MLCMQPLLSLNLSVIQIFFISKLIIIGNLFACNMQQQSHHVKKIVVSTTLNTKIIKMVQKTSKPENKQTIFGPQVLAVTIQLAILKIWQTGYFEYFKHDWTYLITLSWKYCIKSNLSGPIYMQKIMSF